MCIAHFDWPQSVGYGKHWFHSKLKTAACYKIHPSRPEIMLSALLIRHNGNSLTEGLIIRYRMFDGQLGFQNT